MTHVKNDKLRKAYESVQVSAKRFCSALVEQIKELTSQNNITLAVPIESRVKNWSSISAKIERSKLELTEILELNDLVGIRLILLFKRDLNRCIQLIEDNFTIIEKEDTATRLDESQFGYQSYHYVIKLPEQWLSIPTFRDFAEYKAEIQIRTIAQHIWAATSHALQYKQEASVPSPLRRSIYRVSALLETVDLEFERVLGERERYIEKLEPEIHDETLNVDLLKEILDARLPIENQRRSEPYSELIQNLSKCGITKTSELISLIDEQLGAVLEYEKQFIKRVIEGEPLVSYEDKERIIKQSVFFAHVGLVRTMLENKFGRFSWQV